MTLALVLAALTSSAPILFDAGAGRWLVLSRAGEQLQLVATVAGHKATDAAISPDGKAWAFIAADAQLRLWREGWDSARGVPRSGDVLQAPAFSPDGKWLYFVQNDLQTMQAKAPMRYSQIWRVAAEGGVPQKLTRSAGCRMWPAPLAGGGALVTHATCRGGRGVDLLTAKGTEEVLVRPEGEHGETAVDARGERLVFARDGLGTELHVLELATRKTTLWARVPWRTSRLRPAFSEDGKAVWIQNEEGVWRATADGAVVQHVVFATLEEKR